MSATQEDKVVCFRFLEEGEYDKLKDIILNEGGSEKDIPHPNLSRIAIAELDDEIIAFYTFQLMPHAEPMWIKEEYRNNGIWVKLVEMVLPLTNKKTTYMVATTPQVVEMCERMGLRKIEHPVYAKDVA